MTIIPTSAPTSGPRVTSQERALDATNEPGALTKGNDDQRVRDDATVALVDERIRQIGSNGRNEAVPGRLPNIRDNVPILISSNPGIAITAQAAELRPSLLNLIR